MRNLLKRNILLAIALIILFSACNQPGTQSESASNIDTDLFESKISESLVYYIGSMSCFDCDSVVLKLQLDKNGTFILEQYFAGKTVVPEIFAGNWTLDSNFLSLNLQPSLNFRIENEFLQMIDTEGFDVYSNKGYTLKISEEPLIVLSKGKYFYFADAAIYTMCEDNRTYPLANNAFSYELETLFLVRETEEFFIATKGRKVWLKNEDGNTVEHFFIEEFDSIIDGCGY